MNKEDLKKRTKKFALLVIKLTQSLPYNRESDVLAKQLVRSATSVAANYRAACRSRSQAEFISKINICEEEADESLFWLEMFVESGIISNENLEHLLKEADELTAIFVASGRTAKFNKSNSSKPTIRNQESELRNH